MDNKLVRQGLRRREHLLSAMVTVLRRRDELVAILSDAEDDSQARQRVMGTFGLDDVQAIAVLDIQMRRLTREQLAHLETELAEVQAQQRDLD